MKILHKRGNIQDLPTLSPSEIGVALDEFSVHIGSNEGNKRILTEKDLDGIKVSLETSSSKVLMDNIEGLFTASNLEEAMNQLFKSANSIKTTVATTIGAPLSNSDTSLEMSYKIRELKKQLALNLSHKDVTTHPDKSLQEIIAQVLLIPTAKIDGGVQRYSKLNVVAPYSLDIVLNEAYGASDITTSLIEYIKGDVGAVHYLLQFDNGDESDFEPNELVEYDGVMKLQKIKTTGDMTKNAEWVSGKTTLFEYKASTSGLQNISAFRIF